MTRYGIMKHFEVGKALLPMIGVNMNFNKRWLFFIATIGVFVAAAVFFLDFDPEPETPKTNDMGTVSSDISEPDTENRSIVPTKKPAQKVRTFANDNERVGQILDKYQNQPAKLREHLTLADVRILAKHLDDDSFHPMWGHLCDTVGFLGRSDYSTEVVMSYIKRKEDWDNSVYTSNIDLLADKAASIWVLGFTGGGVADEFLIELTTEEGIAQLMEVWELGKLEEAYRKDQGRPIEWMIFSRALEGLGRSGKPENIERLNVIHDTLKSEMESMLEKLRREKLDTEISAFEIATLKHRGGAVFTGLGRNEMIRSMGVEKFLELHLDSDEYFRTSVAFAYKHGSELTPLMDELDTWMNTIIYQGRLPGPE